MQNCSGGSLSLVKICFVNHFIWNQFDSAACAARERALTSGRRWPTFLVQGAPLASFSIASID